MIVPLVHCGNATTCKANIMNNFGCCYLNNQLECIGLGMCPGLKFFCDGQEDCAMGDTCCLFNNEAKCVSFCAGETLCHDAFECLDGQKMCDTTKYNTIGACLP
jgi:hypothetical protein